MYASPVVRLDGDRACPLTAATAVSELYLRWHSYWKCEEYPCAGGKLEQGCKFVQAMLLLDAADADEDEERRKRNAARK